MVRSTYCEVDLSELPRGGSNRGNRINWINSVGKRIKFNYNDMHYYITIIDYDKESKYVKVKYKDNYHNMHTGAITGGNFGRIIGFITNEFRIELGSIFNDEKRNITIMNRERRVYDGRTYKYYQYKCSRCGNEDWIREDSLLNQQQGCNACCIPPAKVVLGINTIWDKASWMIDIGISEEIAKRYTPQSNEKVSVICIYCKRLKSIRINQVYKNKSISCTCGDGISYPEKFMYNILTQLNVEFETQYSPNYLNKKKSDFYLPKLSLIIETDGALGHKGGRVHSRSNKSIEELVACDKWKDEQHSMNGLKTIRIDCFESNIDYIKNSILESDLKEYLDLSLVDFNEADVFAIKSNKIKDSCDLWNNNKTIKEITTILNISDTTVRSNLKKGTVLGWCNYNATEERHKNNESNKKAVYVYKDDKFVGKYNSTKELSEISVQEYGVKFDYRNISAVCLGKQKTHKGYKFTYKEIV